MRIFYEQDLKGRAVLDGSGRVVGEVDGLLVDNATWRVDALRVKLRRDAADQMGAGRSMFHAASVDVPVELVHAAGDAVILNVATTALRDLRPGAEGAPAP